MSQLAPGLMVQEYQIEQVLGVGAFGITYRTYMPGSQEAAYEKFNQ